MQPSPVTPVVDVEREMRQFRNTYRRLVWEQRVDEMGKPRAYKAALKAPARAAREAHRVVRAHGPRARQASGVSLATQFTRFWWLHLRHGITDDNFYRYQMYRDDRWPRATHFVQVQETAHIYRVIGARAFRREVETLTDKRRFADWCAIHDVATSPVLVEFAGGRVTRDATGGVLPASDLFSKSGADYGGKKVAHWRYVGDRTYEAGGRRLTDPELLEFLAAESASGPMVLQAYLRNHPSLASLAPAALSTIRVVTCRRVGGEARVVLAVFRMGVGSAVADNYARGGIVSAIDLATGELGPAVRFDETSYDTKTFTSHPDTGGRIAGVRLPHMAEALRMAQRAHDLLGGLPCIGWDVAPLEHGPVLLEGNWNPCVKIAQLPGGIPLAETEFIACLNAHLRQCFPVPDWSAMRPLARWNPHGEIKQLGTVGVPTPVD
jgi:hypothetical protein